jgi:hypothetical protein
MKRLVALFLCALFVSAVSFALEKMLSRADIDRFVQTYPEIARELEKLNIDVDSEDGDMSVLSAASLPAKAIAIFTSRGWNENYYEKFATIMQGLYLIQLEEQMLASSPDIQQALDELDATPVSPQFTLEMKQQMRDMMLSSIKAMNQSLYEQLDNFAPGDLELLRENKDRILKAIDSAG